MQGIQVKYWQQGREFIVCDAARLDDPHPQLFDSQWWTQQGLVEASFEGRGTVYVVRHGTARWVLRGYRRGGLVAKFAHKAYMWAGLDRTRPWREWRLLAQLHGLGLPVPRPVAAHVTRADVRYSGHILTELIEGAQSLKSALIAGDWGDADWQRLGTTLRRFHEAGVHHPDLNVSNILRRADGALFLIDFDKGRLGADPRQQHAELERLSRSLHKLAAHEAGRPFDAAGWKRMLVAYAAGGGP